MKDKSKKSIGVWIGIAKSGELQVFVKEPVRGKYSWIGEIYINSIVYETIRQMVENTSFSWANDPEYIELMYRKANDSTIDNEDEEEE